MVYRTRRSCIAPWGANAVPVEVRHGRSYVGPFDLPASASSDAVRRVALIRPHEIEIGPQEAGWRATVVAVRVIGPIVRVNLCAHGQQAEERLEAELSRERYEAEHIGVGSKVGLRFRRFQVYPIEVPRIRPWPPPAPSRKRERSV